LTLAIWDLANYLKQVEASAVIERVVEEYAEKWSVVEPLFET
jgi:hypothetical protein